MRRTTLRQLLTNPAEVYTVALPEGVRSYKVWTSSSNGGVRFSSDLTEVINGGGSVVEFDPPYDSGKVYIEAGTLFFQGAVPGVTVALEVFHDPSVPGEAGDPSLKWIPAAAAPFTIGSGPSWSAISSWFNNTDETSTLLPPGTTSDFLLAHFYKPLSTLIPSGSTITKITINLYGRIVGGGNNPNVGLSRLTMIRDGVEVGDNYVDTDGHGPAWGASERKLSYTPTIDPLWGDTWSPSDFTQPNLTNPYVQITIIQEGQEPLNEIQEADATEASAGTFTFTFDGQTTAAINYNANAAAVQAALEALSNIAPGDVIVTSSSTSIWSIEFDATYAETDVSLLTANAAGLTLSGGGSMSVSYLQSGQSKNTIYQWLCWRLNNPSAPYPYGGFTPSTEHARLGVIQFSGGATPEGHPLADPGEHLFPEGSVAAWRSGTRYWPEYNDQQYTQDIQAMWDLITTPQYPWWQQELRILDGDFIVRTGLIDRSIWAPVPAGTMQRYYEVEFTGNLAGTDMTFYEKSWVTPSMTAAQETETQNRSLCLQLYRKTYNYSNAIATLGSDQYVENYTGNTQVVGSSTWYETPSGYWVPFKSQGLKQRGGRQSTKQRVIINNTGVNGGTFTLTFKGQTTAAIAWNASAAAVDSAFEALSTVGAGGVTVTKGTLGGKTYWDIQFDGSLGTTQQPLIVATPSLTGATVFIRVTQEARLGRNEKQLVTLTGGQAGGTWGLSLNGEDTASLSITASAANVQTALENLATPGPGDFTVTGSNGGPYTVEFTGTLAETDIDLLEPINSGNDGVGFNLVVGNFGTEVAELFIRYSEIVVVFERP